MPRHVDRASWAARHGYGWLREAPRWEAQEEPYEWSTAGLRSGGDLCYVWRRLDAGRDGVKGIRTWQAVPAVKRPNDDNCTANDRILGHECILTLRQAALHVIEVAPRVAAVITVVPHHEQMVFRDDYIELDGQWLGGCAVRSDDQVGGLIERLAVDRHTTGIIAARHTIPRQTDHPLDQMLSAGVGQPTDKLQGSSDRTTLRHGWAGEPAPRICEDDDLAPFDRAELLYDDPVVDLKRVLHRDGWNEEHLTHKPTQQRGHNERADDDNSQFLQESQHMLAKRQVFWFGII